LALALPAGVALAQDETRDSYDYWTDLDDWTAPPQGVYDDYDGAQEPWDRRYPTQSQGMYGQPQGMYGPYQTGQYGQQDWNTWGHRDYPVNQRMDRGFDRAMQDSYDPYGAQRYQDPRFQDPRAMGQYQPYQDQRFVDPRFGDSRQLDDWYQDQGYQDQRYQDQRFQSQPYQGQGWNNQQGWSSPPQGRYSSDPRYHPQHQVGTYDWERRDIGWGEGDLEWTDDDYQRSMNQGRPSQSQQDRAWYDPRGWFENGGSYDYWTDAHDEEMHGADRFGDYEQGRDARGMYQSGDQRWQDQSGQSWQQQQGMDGRGLYDQGMSDQRMYQSGGLQSAVGVLEYRTEQEDELNDWWED
jgi:hypothetical protein